MLRKLFSDRQFNRQLIRLGLPIAIQNLMLASVAAADAFMLGSIDSDLMGAVSLATQIQFIQNMVLVSIVNAAGVLGAQYWGKGDKKTMNQIFCISLRVSAAASMLFFLGCMLCPALLMSLFTNDPELIEIGVRYLRIAGWSYLLTGISQSYLAIMKVSEHTTSVAIISSSAVVANILLNAVLIFGFVPGIPAMGVEGAALATLIARAGELIACVVLSLRKGYIRLDPRGLLRVNRLLSHDFIRCFLPLLGSGLLWGVGFTSYTSFIGHMGKDATAANSIASVVRDLVCCLSNGLANGGGILVGNVLGKGDLVRGKESGDRLAVLSFLCGFVSTVLMLAATPLLMSAVKLSEAARGYLIGMMVIMAIYMIGRSVNTVVICGIFAAGGDTLFDLYSLVVTMWALAVPLAALGTYVFHWPVLVVYACTCLDEVGKIPWVMFHYRRYKWVRDLTRTNL